MNLFKTLAMVGLLGVGIVYGEDNKSTDDTQKDTSTTLDNYFSDQRTKIKKTSGTSDFRNMQNADVVFLATFNPKRTPKIIVTEHLKGGDRASWGWLYYKHNLRSCCINLLIL